jgi:hypothetical protein
MDVWIFNSWTGGRKKLLPKRRAFSVLVFYFGWDHGKKFWKKYMKIVT